MFKVLTYLKKQDTYLAMILASLLMSGSALFSKIAVSHGMNPSVFLFYRQAFSTILMAPIAYILDRKRAPLTRSILCKIFVLSLIGITLCFNLYNFALQSVSATVVSAIINMVPSTTFIMAVILRMEKFPLCGVPGITKVLGSLCCLAGALMLAFYPGPSIKWYGSTDKRIGSKIVKGHKMASVEGTFLMIAAELAWALWIILQGMVVKIYPAKHRLNVLQCFFGCLQTIPVAVISERNPNSWKLGWDVNLLSVLYTAIATNGIAFWLQLWTMEKKGPVFAAAFAPLQLLFTAIFSAVIWKEQLHWGSVIAALVLVGGLYCFLLGKTWEEKGEIEGLPQTEEPSNARKIHAIQSDVQPKAAELCKL